MPVFTIYILVHYVSLPHLSIAYLAIHLCMHEFCPCLSICMHVLKFVCTYMSCTNASIFWLVHACFDHIKLLMEFEHLLNYSADRALNNSEEVALFDTHIADIEAGL